MTWVFLIVGLLAWLLQIALPSFPGHVQPHLVVLVVIYAARQLADGRIFILTATLGLVMDLFSPQNLGSSMLSLSLLAGLILLQPWEEHRFSFVLLLLLALIGTFFYSLVDYLLYSAQVGRWRWTLGLSTKMAFDAILNMVLALLLFPMGSWLLQRGEGRRKSLNAYYR